MNHYKKSIAYFFLFFIPPLILLSIVYVHFYRAEVQDIQTRVQSSELTYINHRQQLLLKDLSRLGSDALFLSEHQDLLTWLSLGNEKDKVRFEQDIKAFVRYNSIYDQARILGLDGHEKVRVNWKVTGPELVRSGSLQDKSERYYFKAALKLKPGQFYISPMDLNVENGTIERPYKPVLRVSAPIYNSANELLGVVVLNFLGQRMLDQIQNNLSESTGEFWIANKKGYWLLHPDTEMLWGFQISDRKNHRIDTHFPGIAKLLAGESLQGQHKTADGLITYKKIDISIQSVNSRNENAHALSEEERLQRIANLPHWNLVSVVSQAKLDKLNHVAFRKLLEIYLLLSAIIAISSGFLAHRLFLRESYLESLEESEKQFRGLLNSAPDPFVIVDRQGKIIIVNEEAEKRFGYSRDELLGESIEVLVPTTFQQIHNELQGKHFDSPVNAPFSEGKELFGLRHDGSEFPVEITLSPLATKESFFVISIIRDITARKKAEAARLHIEARYRYLVEKLPVGVFRFEAGEHVRWQEINPEMRKLFALSEEDSIEHYELSDFICEKSDWENLTQLIERDEKINALELKMHDVNKVEFYASVSAILYTDEEDKTYWNGIIENISQRKLQEEKIRHLNESLRRRSSELETINKELESFSYSVSHDLRAPLRAMDGFSRTLLQDYSDNLDDRGRDRLNRIRNASQRMGQLIDDLLNLSRVSRTEIKWQEVDISKMAHEVVEELQHIQPDRKVSIEIEDDIQFRCDKHLIRIVLNNLIGNAWKFTSKQENAKISIGLQGENREILFVKDNGAGFDMEFTNKLFGAFQRLHDAHEYPGTGIGLATVQRIMNKHGGKIWADSQIEKGATFFLTLYQESAGELDE
ncbi:Phytochrome-like protein cph1 [Thalassocella blandensis]|nr:Phytochrome-like protein cph1 [Thalassocella blandensis]